MKNKILFAIFAVLLVLVTVFAASAQTALFTINSAPVTTATVGQQYTYTMTSNVLVSGTVVNYALVSGPTGMSVNPTTGVVVWNPTATGTFAVNLSAYDSPAQTYKEYQTFNVVVSSASTSSMLEIDEIQVKVNGKKDTLSSPGTVDEDAELGDEIELKITVKNNFAVDNTSTVIRNIDMEVSSDIDEADGLDESISRLNAGDDDEMTISFVIDPSSVLPSDAPFDITIDVEGTTTDGTVHRDSWTISLDMDTKSRDLYILNAEATPLKFDSCQENRIRVDFDVRNIGSRDLDDAAVRLKVSSLGINKIVSGIELDSGDDDQYSDYVTIPAGVAPGTYNLDVDAYPQKTVNTVTSMSAFEFEVLECKTGIVNPSTPGNVNPITPSNPGTVNIPNVTISGTPVSSAVGNKNIFNADNTLYLVLLGVLVVLLVTVIVLLAVKIKN